MHERSLVLALVRDVERIVARRREEVDDGALRRVVEVRVQAGPLAGVEPMLLASAFAETAPSVLGPDARLVIEQVDFAVHCDACATTTATPEPRFSCPACGERRVSILQGDALVLESVLLEEASTP